MRQMEYTVVRKNVKRISLRVLSDGTVQVTAPKRADKKMLDRFVEEKSSWILAQQKGLQEKKQYREAHMLENRYMDGGNMVLLGKGYPLRVEETGRKQLQWDGQCFHATGCVTADEVKHLAETFYRKQLEEVIIPKVNLDARRQLFFAELPDPEIQIRKMKASWGICYYKENRIRLNLWLAMAPPECIRQVLIHEYVHFFHPDHSAGFYGMLEKAEPRYKELKQQLSRSINLRE